MGKGWCWFLPGLARTQHSAQLLRARGPRSRVLSSLLIPGYWAASSTQEEIGAASGLSACSRLSRWAKPVSLVHAHRRPFTQHCTCRDGYRQAPLEQGYPASRRQCHLPLPRRFEAGLPPEWCDCRLLLFPPRTMHLPIFCFPAHHPARALLPLPFLSQNRRRPVDDNNQCAHLPATRLDSIRADPI